VSLVRMLVTQRPRVSGAGRTPWWRHRATPTIRRTARCAPARRDAAARIGRGVAMSSSRARPPRRRSSLLPRAVAAVAVVAVVAGCGQATPSVTRAGGKGAGQATASQVSASSNRERAERAAARLLTLATVPPGAVRLATAPAQLRMPLARPLVSSQVDRQAYWRIAMGFDATLAWLRAHPPQGLRHDMWTRRGFPPHRLGGDSYAAPDAPGVTGQQLQLEISGVDDATTVIRADALAIWHDPTPLPDTTRGRRLRVTLAGGCPGSDAHRVGVTNSGSDLARELLPAGPPSAALVCRYGGLNEHPRFGLLGQRRLDARSAARLTAAIRRVDLSHSDGAVIAGCPMDDASAIVLAVRYPGRPDVDLWYYDTGCRTVANGLIRANAWTFDDPLLTGKR
jgi:hypothetical protein